MKRVNNELLKKEFKKTKNNLIIGLVFFVLAIGSSFLIYYEEKLKDKSKDTVYLNEVIEGDANADVKVSLNVADTPYRFATYTNDTSKAYYVIYDGKYYYIAYLSSSDYNDLANKKDLKENNATIYGETKIVTSDIKKLAVEWYNKTHDKKITSSDFEDMFGGVYIDVTNESTLTVILAITAMISYICSFSFIIVYFVRNSKIKKVFGKLEDDELAKIEKELEDKDTFHYERAHIILTKNYLICFGGNIYIMKYNDIFWVYEHRLKQNGITTQKSLFVLTKDGKTVSILNVDGVTKKSTAVLREVMETIANKNEKILIGYTKENIDKATDFRKELKEKRKAEKNSRK